MSFPTRKLSNAGVIFKQGFIVFLMLVNGIFGVIIEVETLHNFPNESFDDFF